MPTVSVLVLVSAESVVFIWQGQLKYLYLLKRMIQKTCKINIDIDSSVQFISSKTSHQMKGHIICVMDSYRYKHENTAVI